MFLPTAGCSTPASLASPDAASPDALHALDRRSSAAEIPDSLRLVAGQLPDSKIQVGDCAVFSLRIQSAAGVRSWFVRAAIAAHRPHNIGSGWVSDAQGSKTKLQLKGLVRCHVQVVDAAGVARGESVTSPLSVETLKIGLVPVCQFFSKWPGMTSEQFASRLAGLSAAKRRSFHISILCVDTIVKLLLNTKALAPLLEAAIRKPSLMQVALNFRKGVGVQFRPREARAWNGKLPISIGAGYVLPVDLEAYGQLALRASMVVARSEAPVHLSAAVLSVVGIHPEHSDTQVRLRLERLGRVPADELKRIQQREREQSVVLKGR